MRQQVLGEAIEKTELTAEQVLEEASRLSAEINIVKAWPRPVLFCTCAWRLEKKIVRPDLLFTHRLRWLSGP